MEYEELSGTSHQGTAAYFLDSPGFRLDVELEPGMSGSPVFFDGALVGIFSGPDYVASLWLLAIHTYRDRDRNTNSMAGQFDSGEIKVRDWG